jgi:penicillin-binding protein 1A
MSDPERQPGVVVPLRPGDGAHGNEPDGRVGKVAPVGSTRTRIKKLRLFALLTGFGILGAVSAMFGMLMAVAPDLPALERLAVPELNSVLEDRNGEGLGLLTNSSNRILLKEREIAPVMEHAIIAIEDRRFYTNRGVDFRSTGRALYQDLLAGKAVQGASTIPQQFVKNATAAQDERTISNKVREAALAFHVKREWRPEQILRNYLNSIYFGNGAYGLEAAARTYFGWNHPECGEESGRKCAELLEPAEAALIAGVVASPSGYDPVFHPVAARRRRDLVLRRMREQGYLDPVEYTKALATELPGRGEVRPPREETTYPYFTSWFKQQVVDELGGGRVGARRAFEGGLRIRTTIDSKLQDAAQAAVTELAGGSEDGGPEAAVVVLDNATSEVRALVGGPETATTSGRSTSPPRGSASPARRSSPSSSPRRSTRGSRPDRPGARASRPSTCRTPPSASWSTTTRTPTPEPPRSPGRRRSPTTPSTRRWGSRWERATSRGSRGAWGSAPPCRATTR